MPKRLLIVLMFAASLAAAEATAEPGDEGVEAAPETEAVVGQGSDLEPGGPTKIKSAEEKKEEAKATDAAKGGEAEPAPDG